MFWDTTYTASPHLEDLLAKEVCSTSLPSNLSNLIYFLMFKQDVTLKELLDDDEILTEYKTMNKALVAL